MYFRLMGNKWIGKCLYSLTVGSLSVLIGECFKIDKNGFRRYLDQCKHAFNVSENEL